MKYVILYESADDVMTTAPQHFPAHKSRLDDFHRRGEILMVGTFGDPRNEGSMAIFPSREAAESFVADDPFVLNGVVKSYQIREWNETLTDDHGRPL
ncbi:MAG TPA: YciI family protein [Actinoplanes sp.]